MKAAVVNNSLFDGPEREFLVGRLWSQAAASPFRAVAESTAELPTLNVEQRAQLVTMLRNLADRVEAKDGAIVGLHVTVCSEVVEDGKDMTSLQSITLLDQYGMAALYSAIEPHGQHAMQISLPTIMENLAAEATEHNMADDSPSASIH